MPIISSSSRWSLALLPCSIHHSQSLISQLWRACNLHDDHNFPVQLGRFEGHHHPILCVRESLSCVWLFATPWTVVYQAPLSMEFSRQGYWSGLLCRPPGDLPDPGVEPSSPRHSALEADPLPRSHLGIPCTVYSTNIFWMDLIEWLVKRIFQICSISYL